VPALGARRVEPLVPVDNLVHQRRHRDGPVALTEVIDDLALEDREHPRLERRPSGRGRRVLERCFDGLPDDVLGRMRIAELPLGETQHVPAYRHQCLAADARCSDFPALRRRIVDTVRVNVGYRCNQSCVHCHVYAGPDAARK
jgi:hypothetical protein